MTAIELFLNQPWVARAGWTLVHFLWQGTLLAVLLAATRGLAGRWLTTRARYALACCTLGAMTLAPLASFLALARPDAGALPAPVWLVNGAGWERALPWLVVVWFCGATGFSVRLIGGWRLTTRLRTVGVRPAPPEWEQVLDELIRRMRVSAPARLLISSRVAVPVVVGWFRPLILMPVAALTGLPLEQARALLAHELAHVLRRDYLVNILQSIAEALLFYHPAVWWVSGQIRAERELCCDDLAVAASGDALTYAYALADLDSARRTSLKTALAADGGSLLQRIRRLAGEAQPLSHNLPGPGTAWAVGLLWLAAVGAAAMQGAIDPPALPLRARFDAPPMPLAIPMAAPRVASAVPAVSVRERAPAAVAALLFDPLFAPLRAQALNSSASPQDKKKIHVSGTILSLTGEPVKKATVRLLLTDPPLDQRPASYSETTDDGGKFTIEDVQPGSYTLHASKTGFLSILYGARTPSSAGAIISVGEDTDVERLEIKLTPQGIVSGRITDVDGEPVPHAWVYLVRTVYVNGRKGVSQSSATADSLGIYTFNNVSPGRYFLGAQPMENPPGLERGMTDLMSYYPSVPYAEGAPEFEVKAGVRVDGINVKLLRGKTYFVRGKVTFNGAPVKGSFSMRVTNPPPATGAGSWTCMVRDGLFTMHDQSPGPHLMEVLSAGSEMPMRGLVGKMVFTITDSDVDVVFPLQQGVEVSGVLRAEGDDWQSYFSAGKGPSGSPAPIPRPAILLTAIESRNARSYGQANDAGAFTLTPAIAGDYLLDVTGLSKGSYVKSVRYGAGDATQGPLRVESSAAKLEIEISSKGASINGVLRGDKGEPLSGYVVSVWPKTPNLWSATHGVQSTSSDQRGTFKISGLAPGAYYVAAFEEIESGLRQFPGFLEKFENRAESADLSEGSQASVNVKPIPKEAAEAEVAKLP